MKIIATQHNALYTLMLNDYIYIRQYSKFSIAKHDDQIVWYVQEGNDNMTQITDPIELNKLEKEFNSLIE